jgi:hypothetical protein
MQNGGAMMHHERRQFATLIDVSQIGDSPMMRAMSGELVSLDIHEGLVSIARYEEGLD